MHCLRGLRPGRAACKHGPIQVVGERERREGGGTVLEMKVDNNFRLFQGLPDGLSPWGRQSDSKEGSDSDTGWDSGKGSDSKLGLDSETGSVPGMMSIRDGFGLCDKVGLQYGV